MGPQPPPDGLIRGIELARDGRLPEALLAFDRFKQSNPRDARSYIYSGRALIEAGRLEDAQNELQKAARLELPSARAALAYARAVDAVGWSSDTAIEALSRFKDSPRLEAEGLWFLSDLYYRQRRTAEALGVLEAFSRRRPKDPRIDLRRAEIHFREGKYKESLRYFQRVVVATPDNAAAQYGLGQATWMVRGTEDAKEPLLKAVQLKPTDAGYLHTLGLICFKLGDEKEAIRYLERAGAAPDPPVQVFFDLGNAYRKAGNPGAARKALEQYEKRYAGDEARKNQRAVVEQLLNQGQRQLDSGAVFEAVKSFRRVIETDSSHWQAHSFLAKIYLSSRRAPLALPHLRRMLEIAPENSEGSFLMAFYLSDLGDYKKALSYARKSKQLLPGNAELRNLLGNIYLALDRRDLALEEYRAAMRLEPDNTAFRMNYASVSR
ncbi:MAG: tetratricopeptide repeat protein [Acidobacteriota bacterium]